MKSTRNVYLTNQYNRWDTANYFETSLSPFDTYLIVYLIVYVNENFTPSDSTTADEDEVINVMVALGFGKKEQCGLNTKFDQIFDLEQVIENQEPTTLQNALALLDETQKNNLFELIISEKIATNNFEGLEKARDAVKNKDGSYYWNNLVCESINYNIYANKILKVNKEDKCKS